MAIRQKEHQVTNVDLLYIIALLCILGMVLFSFSNGIGVRIGEETQYIKYNYSLYKDNNTIIFGGTTAYNTRFAPLGLIGLFLPVIGGFLAYIVNSPKYGRNAKIICSIVSVVLILIGIVAAALYPNIWVLAQKETTLYPLIKNGTAKILLNWTQYCGMFLSFAAAVLISFCTFKVLRNKPIKD